MPGFTLLGLTLDARGRGKPSTRRRMTAAAMSAVRLPLLAAALASMLVAGCGSKSTPEEIVASRAQARLDALVAHDFNKAFEYASPAYRQSNGIAVYTRAYGGVSRWNKATVSNVTCEELRCDVSVQVDYQAGRAGFENTRSMDERWIEIDGTWYIYLK